MRCRTGPTADRYRDLAGPSQSSDRRDVSQKPILVMRVSRDPRLAAHSPGATADHGGDLAAWLTKSHSSLDSCPFHACQGIPTTKTWYTILSFS
jgi:hypothetical protein